MKWLGIATIVSFTYALEDASRWLPFIDQRPLRLNWPSVGTSMRKRYLSSAQGRDLPRWHAGHGCRCQNGRLIAQSRSVAFPASQMAAGSLLKPEQFTAVDDYTFRVDFVKPDALTLPDIAVDYSRHLQFGADEKECHGERSMGYGVSPGPIWRAEARSRWRNGRRHRGHLCRNDGWKCGPLPQLRRVIWRMVPSAGNRRALIERGDADVSFDMPIQGLYRVKGDESSGGCNPISNGMFCIELNVTKPPFSNKREGAASGGVCRAVSENHGCGFLRGSQAAVWW